MVFQLSGRNPNMLFWPGESNEISSSIEFQNNENCII